MKRIRPLGVIILLTILGFGCVSTSPFSRSRYFGNCDFYNDGPYVIGTLEISAKVAYFKDHIGDYEIAQNYAAHLQKKLEAKGMRFESPANSLLVITPVAINFYNGAKWGTLEVELYDKLSGKKIARYPLVLANSDPLDHPSTSAFADNFCDNNGQLITWAKPQQTERGPRFKPDVRR